MNSRDRTTDSAAEAPSQCGRRPPRLIGPRLEPQIPWARPDSAFNGNHEHVRTHQPERSHRRGPDLGCVAGVRWYGTRPRPLLRATCAPFPGSYPRTDLRPPPGTVPHPAAGTVLRPGREVRPRLAGVILHFRARRVSLDRLNALLGVSLCLVTLTGRNDFAIRGTVPKARPSGTVGA